MYIHVYTTNVRIIKPGYPYKSRVKWRAPAHCRILFYRLKFLIPHFDDSK